MTVPFATDAIQAVLPGGTVTFTQMFETFAGSALPQPVSGVTITIAAASAGATVIGPTSAGLVTADEATYTYTWACPADTTPGDYLVTFTGAGISGPVTYTQAVTVAQPPSPVPATGVYCTVSQFQQYTGDMYSPPDQVRIILRRASEIIDRAMIGASYAVDADSMPTDPGIIGIFMRATAAQAEFMLADNDPTGIKAQYSSTNVGGISQTRAAMFQAQTFPRLAPQAAVILQNAGALPGAPLLGW